MNPRFRLKWNLLHLRQFASEESQVLKKANMHQNWIQSLNHFFLNPKNEFRIDKISNKLILLFFLQSVVVQTQKVLRNKKTETRGNNSCITKIRRHSYITLIHGRTLQIISANTDVHRRVFRPYNDHASRNDDADDRMIGWFWRYLHRYDLKQCQRNVITSSDVIFHFRTKWRMRS